MLTIRLSRVGKKKQPSYRLILSENARDPWGKSLEFLGNYNPRTNPSVVNLEAERIKYWISKGAQTSATVHNLLVSQKIIIGPKVKADNVKKKKTKE
ncbi:30S ribosomal protein S16 [Candidatus Kuenenbacteria bacterium HGW-Kuenenbacteria-1]|uniref:Small ribosomal subunit protein bS16 n=1 Tax=Candidatus Kuenenbacteria bacterium HGW-Kuenenbacteria-1 TaxID=2013812 RepID=A0A2N1UMR6_9BACT|nr:MAG: 30S ribosomal protein S16 [Candidatus Kuenenbacteria bacterium HGW-Kuenenbacteria-1]